MANDTNTKSTTARQLWFPQELHTALQVAKAKDQRKGRKPTLHDLYLHLLEDGLDRYYETPTDVVFTRRDTADSAYIVLHLGTDVYTDLEQLTTTVNQGREGEPLAVIDVMVSLVKHAHPHLDISKL